MSAWSAALIDAARGAGARYRDEEIDETVAFLEWLREHHFVFLGDARLRDRRGPRRAGTRSWSQGRGPGSCATRSDSTYAEGQPLSDMRRACASASRAATCC